MPCVTKWLRNERTGEFAEYASLWVAIGKDKDGKFYTTQRPWTIREKDSSENQKAKMRLAKCDTIMVIDVVGTVNPVLEEVDRPLRAWGRSAAALRGDPEIARLRLVILRSAAL